MKNRQQEGVIKPKEDIKINNKNVKKTEGKTKGIANGKTKEEW